jgi:hypothetical protein
MTTLKQPFPEKSVTTFLLSLAGPLIWALHFAVVYGIQHVACATLGGQRADFWIQTSVIVATVVALLALLLIIVKPNAVLRIDREGGMPQNTQAFLLGILRLLALLSFYGVLGVGATVFFLPACGSLT